MLTLCAGEELDLVDCVCSIGCWVGLTLVVCRFVRSKINLEDQHIFMP